MNANTSDETSAKTQKNNNAASIKAVTVHVKLVCILPLALKSVASVIVAMVVRRPWKVMVLNTNGQVAEPARDSSVSDGWSLWVVGPDKQCVRGSLRA
mmetsp:Transcript_119426/g.207359  ORF Transcript_119426/g.207359 Transcript_119426/m.207359 type:complete len:98 (-) Transcript_119426:8-301(-)